MKKAQISNTLSWFIATIVIFFILIIFVFFASLKNISNKGKNIGVTVEIVGTDIFLQQEQQRAIYSFFEKDEENKKIYFLVKDFVNNVGNSKEPYLKEEHLLKNICGSFFIIGRDVFWTTDGLSGYSEGKINYYLKYPQEKTIERKEGMLATYEDPYYGYSFYFYNKPSILIKYFTEICK